MQYSTSIASPSSSFIVANICVHVRGCALALGNIRLPGQPEKTKALLRIPTQRRGAADIDDEVVDGRRHALVGPAPHEDPVTPDEDGALHARRISPAFERHDVHSRKAFGHIRRLELALVAELCHRRQGGGIAFAMGGELFDVEQLAVSLHDARDGVDLRVLDATSTARRSERRRRAPPPPESRPRATCARRRCCRGRCATCRRPAPDRARAAGRAACLPFRRDSDAGNPASTNSRAIVDFPAAGRPMIITTSASGRAMRRQTRGLVPDQAGGRAQLVEPCCLFARSAAAFGHARSIGPCRSRRSRKGDDELGQSGEPRQRDLERRRAVRRRDLAPAPDWLAVRRRVICCRRAADTRAAAGDSPTQ